MNTGNKNWTNTSLFHKSPWALNYINPRSSNDIPTSDLDTKPDGYFNRTVAINGCKNPTNTTNTGRATSTTSDIPSGPSRVRPVSFSLPKRSCVLLHQSAAVFIQTGRGKQDGPTAQDRMKTLDQQLKSPSPADVDAVCVDHCHTVNPCCENSKTGTQHPEPAEKGPSGLPGSGAQAPSCDSKPTVPEITGGSGAQSSLCDENGTPAQVGSDCQNGTDLNLNSQITEQISERVNSDSIQKVPEVEIHQQQLSLPQEETDLFCPNTNEPKSSVSGVLTENKECPGFPQTKEAASFTSNPKTSPSALPNRPKEPFCRVMSRDGRRVLLWPTEMVNYTRTSPSVSYSVNPLLYDFRAHNKAKERSAEKKEGLEEGRERIKPSVIKQPDCQQRHPDTEGGSEVKIDEREEEAAGGQGGNPVQVVDHCDGSDKTLDCSGCRDESALKLVPVSAECNHAPAPSLLKAVGRRRRSRGGVRRGERRKGRRKRRGKMERKESERGRRVSPLFVNQMFEEGGEEKLRREGNIKEEKKDKELLSRSTGGREKKMRGEERRIRRDQSERERPGRNDEKRGELLSNLPVNRCNRCNQLCVQVKREASQHQSQQSDSEWGQGLRKPLCRGAACNSVISPVPESVMETPCCPAITPDPAGGDKGTGVMQGNMQAGKEEGQRDAEQRNPRRSEIRAAQQNTCKPPINGVAFPGRGAASSEETGLVLNAHTDAARDAAVPRVPASSGEAACSQRQTTPAGRSDAVMPQSPCCPTQHADKLRMRPPCVDMTLRSLSETLQRARTAKRKGGSPEPATSRKRRRRGRRQTKPFVSVWTQNEERSEAGFQSDLSLIEDCKEATSTGDIFLIHGTKSSECEETFSCDTADNPENYCCCHDSRGCANDCSQFNFDPCGGKVTPPGDCHTCSTHAQSTRRDETTDRDGTWESATSHDHSCHKHDAAHETSCQLHEADPRVELHSLTETLSTDPSVCSTDHLYQSTNKQESASCKPDDTFDQNTVSDDQTVSQCSIQAETLSDSGSDSSSCRGLDAHGGQCGGLTANHSNTSSRNQAEHVLMRERREEERIPEMQRQEEEEKRRLERRRVKEKQEEWEKEWVRRKEKEMELEQLFSEKRQCYPHHLPSQCIPLHAPLLLPPSLSSPSSFSFHHTFIQHHLSLLPPLSHLPVSSYPHLLPSFSSHLSPLALSPPPAPLPPPPPLPHSFYASSPIPLLDAPGPFPLAAAFHHPPLYPPPSPAVLPLQVLF